MLSRLFATVRASLADIYAVCGAGSVAYGAWLYWEPAGFMVGGTLLIALGVIHMVAGPAE